MVKSCCVVVCKNRIKKGIQLEHVSFHRFPDDRECRAKWIQAIWEAKKYRRTPKKSDVVCSEHFQSHDFHLDSFGNIILNETAVPSKFNPSSIKKQEKNIKDHGKELKTAIVEACKKLFVFTNGITVNGQLDISVDGVEALSLQLSETVSCNLEEMNAGGNFDTMKTTSSKCAILQVNKQNIEEISSQAEDGTLHPQDANREPNSEYLLRARQLSCVQTKVSSWKHPPRRPAFAAHSHIVECLQSSLPDDADSALHELNSVSCVESNSDQLLRRPFRNATHGDVNISCGQCETSCSSADHPMCNVRKFSKPVKKRYQCRECKQQFNYHHSLKLHLLKHNGQRPHICQQCNKSYLTVSHLNKHIDAIHSAMNKYNCGVCGKTFPYETSYKLHQKLHSGVRPYLCATCGRGFITQSARRVHQQLHEVNVDKEKNGCDICQKCFKTAALLRAHSRRHTSDASRHVCEVCGLRFMYRSNLVAHSTVHLDQRTFSCNVCQKAFKTAATLYTHKVVHNNESDSATKHVCTTCGKQFKTKVRLHAHEKRHTNKKPFVCLVCDKGFPDRGGLSKHSKTVHASQPLFACPVCKKASSRLDNLRVHMKTHNDSSLLMLTAGDLMSVPTSEMNVQSTLTSLSIVSHSNSSRLSVLPTAVDEKRPQCFTISRIQESGASQLQGLNQQNCGRPVNVAVSELQPVSVEPGTVNKGQRLPVLPVIGLISQPANVGHVDSYVDLYQANAT